MPRVLLQCLPPELLLSVLFNCSLEDIVHISRTSHQFRNLVRDSAQVWIHAVDAYRLPAPTGISLSTASPTLLYQLALKAVALENNWSSQFARPKHVMKIAQTNTRKFQYRDIPDTRIVHIIPGNEWVILQRLDGLYFQSLHPHTAAVSHGGLLDVEGTCIECSSEPLRDRKGIVLALLNTDMSNPTLWKMILSIFEVEFNTEDASVTPVVVKQKEIKLPTYPGLSIRRVRASIKGPYLACFISAKDFGTAISIVNWQEDTGALAVLDSSDISELFANDRSSTSTPLLDLIDGHVIDSDPHIMMKVTYKKRQLILSVKIPPSLPPLPLGHHDQSRAWSILRLPPPTTHYRPPDGLMFASLIPIYAPAQHHLSILECFFWEKPARGTIITCTTNSPLPLVQTSETTLPPGSAEPDRLRVYLVPGLWGHNHVITQLRQYETGIPSVCFMHPTPGFDNISWVQLLGPKELTDKFPFSDFTVCAIDMVYGRLFVDGYNGMYAIQY
ncbi:hypothetical protein SISNIDRAFT_456407 [Sistotremastrum niveocremeum HHB9708]|uniref:F-box domain-containing protein n=1 Tax=Sistotremastrum niveocremeum HHB9708 TaxID=1314777 RepID=A0A164SUS6_9AGAM|nr:hypothetical protein SISNIDRAFT_456407 [Sistotremastrum niveocremeum HHB9708]